MSRRTALKMGGMIPIPSPSITATPSGPDPRTLLAEAQLKWLLQQCVHLREEVLSTMRKQRSGINR
jgi:hypothetical protein